MDILLFPFTPPAQNGQGAMQKVGGKLKEEAGRKGEGLTEGLERLTSHSKNLLGAIHK